jgi:predicted DNA-binding transcriptional regulator YafY
MDILKTIKEAVVRNKQIIIEFREREYTEDMPKRVSLVDAYGLVYKSDTWYLVGFSHDEKKLRRWDITRISEVRTTKGVFSRPQDFDLPKWWAVELEAFGKGTIRVLMRIDKSAWPRFSRFQWKKENRFFDKETHFEVEMIVDKYEWLIDLVMVNRGDVEILEPLEVRSKIKAVAETISHRHASARDELQSEKHVIDFEILSMTEYDVD